MAVFKDIGNLIILIPPILGLKGNLDMCLASRLSTQANLGTMSSTSELIKMIVGNIAIVQVREFYCIQITHLQGQCQFFFSIKTTYTYLGLHCAEETIVLI